MSNANNIVILTAYNLEHSLVTIGLLEALSTRISVSNKIVVANSKHCFQHLANYGFSDWQVELGSNRHHEFSAWQEGLEHIQKPFNQLSYCIFANDTLGRPNGHLGSLEVRKLEQFIKVRYTKEAIGVVHGSRAKYGDMEIMGYPAYRWITTGIFALSGLALASVNGQIDFFEELQHLVDWDRQSNQLFVSTFNPSLKNHIQHWLYYGAWNKAKGPPQNYVELHFIRMKSMMILCERYLSIQLTSQNVHIINMNHQQNNDASPLHRSLCYITKALRRLIYIIRKEVNRVTRLYG